MPRDQHEGFWDLWRKGKAFPHIKRQSRTIAAELMLKMTHSAKDHRQIVFVSGGDDFFIAD